MYRKLVYLICAGVLLGIGGAVQGAVGLEQATFSNSVGYAAFGDFTIVTSQP